MKVKELLKTLDNYKMETKLTVRGVILEDAKVIGNSALSMNTTILFWQDFASIDYEDSHEHLVIRGPVAGFSNSSASVGKLKKKISDAVEKCKKLRNNEDIEVFVAFNSKRYEIEKTEVLKNGSGNSKPTLALFI